MRVWKKLDHWADEEADAARMYQRLAETSEMYGRGDAGLLRDPDLRVASKWQQTREPNAIWANQYHPDFESAMSFLNQSKKADQMRKRLRVGSIAAVFLALTGYLSFISYDLSVEHKELVKDNDEAAAELVVAEQEKIVALNEVDMVKSEVREPTEPLESPLSTQNTSQTTAQTATNTSAEVQDLKESQTPAEQQNTYLLDFTACEDVEKLNPTGCKSEIEAFLPGKVFVFARVVTTIIDEMLTLRWSKDGVEGVFDEKQFTVNPNPRGFRTYSWNTYDSGSYSASLSDQSGRELGKVSFDVMFGYSVYVI
ncbi:MAG: hypothetical protein AB8B97_26290 [Granulosicoccus sp.]